MLPIVKLLLLALPRVMAPCVPLAVPESIVTEPELPVVASPDLKVTAPVLELLPDVFPERTTNAADGVDPAVWSAVLSRGACRLVAKYPLAKPILVEPTSIALLLAGTSEALMATPERLDRAWLAPLAVYPLQTTSVVQIL